MSTPLPPVPGVLKAHLKWTIGDVTDVSSHFFVHVTSPQAQTSDLTTYANAVCASWAADLQGDQPTNATFTGCMVEDLGHPETVPGVAAVSQAGQLLGHGMTAETCMLINFQIARRYRGGKPRVYWPLGVAEWLADPQHWSTTYTNPAQTKVNSFFASLLQVVGSGPTADYVANVSYYSNKALRPTPVVDKVLSTNINLIPGSQRRRMGR